MKIVFLLFLLLIFFLAFVISPKKNRHEKNIHNSKKIIDKLNHFQFEGQKINYLKKINPFVFEELILSAFENKGYRIKRNKRYTGDGGIDGIMYDANNNKYLIQAKRYKNYINKAHVKEFGKLLEKEKCSGFFIHTGKTGKNSFKEALNYNMEVISGHKLISLITIKNK